MVKAAMERGNLLAKRFHSFGELRAFRLAPACCVGARRAPAPHQLAPVSGGVCFASLCLAAVVPCGVPAGLGAQWPRDQGQVGAGGRAVT